MTEDREPTLHHRLRVVFTPRFEGNPYQELLADALTERGVDVSFAEGPGELTRLRQVPPDVLHLHWERAWTVSASRAKAARESLRLVGDLWALRRSGVRIVWTVHNLLDHAAPHPKLERLAQMAVARSAHRLVVHYSAAVASASRWLRVPPSKFAVMPHGPYGVVSTNQRTAARRALRLPDRGVVLASVGFMRPNKRVPQLVEGVRRSKGDASVVVAGRAAPTEVARLERAAQGDSRVVIRPAHQSRDQLSAVLAAADAVVVGVPDQFTSGSVILAMEHGCAIVGADGPHVRFLCGDIGWIELPMDDPGELAEAIAALDQTDLSARGHWNRERVAGFSWTTAADVLLAEYEG